MFICYQLKITKVIILRSERFKEEIRDESSPFSQFLFRRPCALFSGRKGGGGNISFLIGSPGYYYPWPILFILLQLDSFLLLLLLFYLNGIYLSVTVFTFNVTINKHNVLPRPGSRFQVVLTFDIVYQVLLAVYCLEFWEIVQIS